jgi:peptidoglycan/LPS O-acetylase OafA/YrhL
VHEFDKSIIQKNIPLSRSHGPMTIPSLDGIRAVSVMLVVIAHSGFGHIVPGGLGVTIFFFLSGYLITSLLLIEYADTGSINIPHFIARRFFRLAPPLFIALTGAYLLAIAGILPGKVTLGGYFAQLFYFTNYYAEFFNGKFPEGTGVLWSLAVEEHYYILYPTLLLFLLSRFNSKAIFFSLVVVCAAVLAWRGILIVGYHVHSDRTYTLTDTRIDSIIFGCIFAYVAAGMSPSAARNGNDPLRLWAFIGGLALLFVTLIIRNEVFRETIRYTLQGLALMPIFYFAISADKSLIYRVLNSRLLITVGIYSYSIYLIHYVIIGLLLDHFAFAQMRLLLFGAAVGASVLFAFLIDNFVDPYFRVLRRKLH